MISLREHLKKMNRLEQLQKGNYSSEITSTGFSIQEAYNEKLKSKVQQKTQELMASSTATNNNQTIKNNNIQVNIPQVKSNMQQMKFNTGTGFRSTAKTTTTPIKISNTQNTDTNELPTIEEIKNKKNNVPQKYDGIKDVETYFTKGAFKDGYQVGDVTKTVGSTLADAGTNVVKGVMGVGESTGDLINLGRAYLAEKQGNTQKAEKLKKIATTNTVEDFFTGKYNSGINALDNSSKMVSKAHNAIENNSVLGEKSDALANSLGYVAAMMALQHVGVPWQVTAGVTSFGGEMTQAIGNGASWGEAIVSSAISAGAEIGSEYLSGGIIKLKGTGKTLDKLFESSLGKINNNFVRAFAKYGIDMAGEGVEEIISSVGHALGKGITYGKESDSVEGRIKGIINALEDENFVDDFIGGTVSAGLLGVGKTANSIKSIKSNNTLARNEIIDSSNLGENSKAQLKRLSEKNNWSVENLKNMLQEGGNLNSQSKAKKQSTKLTNNEVSNNNQQVNQSQNKTAQNANMGQIEQDNKNQVKIDSENFAKQVDAVKNGTFPKKDMLTLGKTPQVLKDIGLPDLPITMTQKHLDTIMNESGKYKNANYHGLGEEIIKQLPEAINNPLDIVKSNTKDDSIVLTTYLADKNDNTIVAAIKIDGKGTVNNIIIDTNVMTSAYGKSNYDAFMKKNLENGNLLYDIDRGVIKKLMWQGSNYLDTSTSVDTVDKVSTSNNIIPQNEHNMQVQNEKKSMQENQARMPEQVLLPGAKRNKSLNPTQISNLTLQDANTTPELKSKEYAKGNKQSSFVSNIITDSKFLNEDLRQEMAKEDNIKYYKGITNKETLEKAYQSLNEDGANATLNWFNKDSKNSNAEDVAKGWILLKQYQDTGDYKSAVEVAKKMRNMGTIAGQTVQAYNILSRLTPEGMFYYAQSELSEAYNKMAEGKSKKWLDENKNDFDLTPEETQFIIDKMKSIQGVEDERTKKIALAEIQKLITDKIPAKASQSLKAWMRISMLFNPKTQVRNVAGNAVILPVNMVSDFISSGIDKAISKKTGVRTTGNTNLKNYAKGFGKGLYESYDDFRRGINTRNIEGNRFEVSEGKNFKDKGIGKALNRVDNMLSFMLDAGDRGFYEATFTNSINNQLVLNNTTEVTKDMIDIATQEALQRTWQDNNAYTQTVLTIRNALNGKVGKSKGMGYGLGDILIPFAKTPANLTKAIVDYSPVGLTKTLVLDARKLKNSLENGQYSPQLQHKFVQDLGKGMAGSLLYVLGYALANAGVITGEADEDKDVKNFMKNSLGISSYSIKIGDKTFAYDWAQPVATPFAIMTNFAKYNKENPDASVLDKAISSINIGTEQLLQQSFMESINTVLNGNGTTIENLSQAVLELPSRAIPTLSKQVADMVDTTQRTSFEYGKPIQSAVNSVVAKLPGASKSLPASIDTLGNEIQKYGGENNLWNVMFNPANMNKGKLSNAGAEIYKLYQQTGETTIFPVTAPYYINNKGTKINMTSTERAEYQRKSGQYTQKAINELLANNNYKKLSDDEKVELVSEIVSDSNANAKYEVLGIESEQHEKQRKLIDKISTDNYYDYKLNVMSKTNQKQIAENDDNAELTDIEKMKIITDKRYSSKAKEAIFSNFIMNKSKDGKTTEYEELKEYYANNSALGAKNQRAYEIIDQYIDYKVKADDKIKELRANGTKTEDQKLTEVERIQLLKDCNYNNVQTEALYSTVVAEETGHKIYEELKKLNGKNSIQSYMTFMLSDRESVKEDDGTLSGKSISGSKLYKVQNTLKGMNQLNTISKIYLEATQASIKKYAPRDYTLLRNYLNNVSEAEQTIIMETIQGTTKMKNGKYKY